VWVAIVIAAGVAQVFRPAVEATRAVEAPRVFLLDASALRETRARVRAGDPALAAASAALENAANTALSAGPFSVLDKSVVPPSGDRHDYNERGIGLIETRGLARLVDAVGLLETSRAWAAEDGRAVRDWFSRFLTWMRESRNGRDESAAKNNHGTYYDVQVDSFALFVDRPEIAREVVTAAREKRIASQIEPDGRQPLELARTRSWSYSVMNIDGLTQLATLARHVGVDLWGYQSSDGRSIRAALLYLAPYAFGEQKWPHQQISGWTP